MISDVFGNLETGSKALGTLAKTWELGKLKIHFDSDDADVQAPTGVSVDK